MQLRRHLGLLYGVLVALLITMGVWWVYFLTHEGRAYERFQLQRLEDDRLLVSDLIDTQPDLAGNSLEKLGTSYPHLELARTSSGWEVTINQSAVDRVQQEARRRQRMFTAEGIFFLVLLAAGSTILVLAIRSERDFKRARELFLTGATHELKTPLAGLRLYTETLNRPELDEGERARIRERMLDDISRLENLLEQILALGYDEEMSQQERRLFDVAVETRNVLTELDSFFASHGAQVETDLPTGHQVLGQPFVFGLVLRNLLSNAVLHAQEPGEISLTLQPDGKWLRLAVRDSGPGIPRSERKRIFKEFIRGVGNEADASSTGRGRQQPSGAGLGLYLVKRKMLLMGGDVELRSKVGEGSTFTLVLPAHTGGDA